MKGLICPYCERPAKLVTGDSVYPRRPDLHYKLFWMCRPCDAYVGCHDGGNRPLGRLANLALRRAKMEAHAAFDPIWQNEGMKRGQAYKWLATNMGLTRIHIGELDVKDCGRVVKTCREYRAGIAAMIAAQRSNGGDLQTRFEHAISE